MNRFRFIKKEAAFAILLLAIAFLFWSSVSLQDSFTKLVFLVQNFTKSNQFIGGIIAYAIGFFAGYPLVKKLVSPSKFEKYASLLEQKMSFWLVLLFRTTAPSEIASYALGIARYDFPKYLIITIVSELPISLIGVYASHAFINDQKVILAAIVAGGLIAAAVIVFLFKKALDNHRNSNKNIQN